MDGFTRRKEQSKEDIRRAAEELFSRFGEDRVSVNDIARQAGVSQATIYNNFGSKEELVHDYHNIIVKKIALSFRNILAWKKGWVETFQGMLQSWVDIADRYKNEMAAVAKPGPSSDSAAGPVREAINQEIESSFRDFIKQGKTQGSLKAVISEEAYLAYFRIFQQGFANDPTLHDKLRRDAGLSSDLLTLFIYGISGQPAAD